MGLVTDQSFATVTPRTKTVRRSNRLPDLTVWCGYVALLCLVVSRHEPWFDEAQAWLLVRDSSFGQLLTHRLRYEGTPGLWHYLLFVPVKLGLPYATMSWFAALLASAGELVFVLTAPFPKWVRYSFPFTFFVFYQYAVVARSYVLLPLLLFSIAAVYTRTKHRLALLTVLTALLANVSLHGLVLAGTLTGAFGFLTLRDWTKLDRKTRLSRIAALGALVVVAFLIVLQLRRPADLISFGALNFNIRHLAAVSALKLRDAFTGTFWLSVPLLAATVWWFYQRRILLLFALGAGALLALAGIAYSNVWHEGSLVLWWVFAMWLSWPKARTPVPHVLSASWIIFLAVQMFWSVQTAWFDVRFPYSGSRQLAQYIQSHHLPPQRIFAFGPKSAAVLPYFKSNIFANWPPGQSFWLWSTANTIGARFPGIAVDHPRFVIIAVTHDSDEETIRRRTFLAEQGYRLVRRFDGALFWKSWILEGNFYELYAGSY